MLHISRKDAAYYYLFFTVAFIYVKINASLQN